MSSLLQRIDHGACAMLTSIHRPRHDNDIPPAPTGHIAATTPVAGPATLNSVSQHGSFTWLELAMRVGHNFDRVKNHVQINGHGFQALSIHHHTSPDDGFLPVNTLRKYNRLYSIKAMPVQHSATLKYSFVSICKNFKLFRCNLTQLFSFKHQLDARDSTAYSI